MFVFLCIKANSQTLKQDSIIIKYLNQGAYHYHYLRQGWEMWIDKGLKEDSTIAYLWEMKALPYWKTRKYDLAIKYCDKSVEYDRKRNLIRRGYQKLIFQKDYQGALIDLEQSEKEFGNSYTSDHSVHLYMALCHLQLNEFEIAYQILNNEFIKTTKERGENSIHFLDNFYMGIINYELKNYQNAILYFDNSLNVYKNFSDAKFYKGICLLELKQTKEAKNIMLEAKKDFEAGYSITEDDAFYEKYPYQVNWYMGKWLIPNYKEPFYNSNGIEIKTLNEYYSENKDLKLIPKLIEENYSKGTSSILKLDENEINNFGYYLMNNQLDTDALNIFQSNIKLFPNSSNAHDSYGECLLKLNRKIESKKAYLKSLELDPKNDNAKKKLIEIE